MQFNLEHMADTFDIEVNTLKWDSAHDGGGVGKFEVKYEIIEETLLLCSPCFPFLKASHFRHNIGWNAADTAQATTHWDINRKWNTFIVVSKDFLNAFCL